MFTGDDEGTVKVLFYPYFHTIYYRISCLPCPFRIGYSEQVGVLFSSFNFLECFAILSDCDIYFRFGIRERLNPLTPSKSILITFPISPGGTISSFAQGTPPSSFQDFPRFSFDGSLCG